jgi:hypothetical protein
MMNFSPSVDVSSTRCWNNYLAKSRINARRRAALKRSANRLHRRVFNEICHMFTVDPSTYDNEPFDVAPAATGWDVV